MTQTLRKSTAITGLPSPGGFADHWSETVTQARDRIALERDHVPYLRWRSPGDVLHTLPLDADHDRLSIGRSEQCHVALTWDASVSRVHAVLERVGTDWVLSDDGLSRNGTWVEGIRIASRVRLTPGTQLRCGNTIIQFHDPAPPHGEDEATQNGASFIRSNMLTPMQRAVLVELCRPITTNGPYSAPARNQDIADTLHISVQTVKSHLRALFTIFGVGGLAQNQKRAKLVEAAVQLGIVAVAAGD